MPSDFLRLTESVALLLRTVLTLPVVFVVALLALALSSIAHATGALGGVLAVACHRHVQYLRTRAGMI